MKCGVVLRVEAVGGGYRVGRPWLFVLSRYAGCVKMDDEVGIIEVADLFVRRGSQDFLLPGRDTRDVGIRPPKVPLTCNHISSRPCK